ncbi:MAG: hypothetical protein ACLR4Z_04255 [Butyricicoccaceae bacterium]
MNDAMDESQKAPAPVYAYPPIDLLTQGKHASVAGAEAELRESSALPARYARVLQYRRADHRHRARPVRHPF